MYDVIIIGAGVVGCAVARELSKTTARVAVLEARSDVGTGASSANSGIVHSGYDCEPGTLMARFNKRGNELFYGLCDTLEVPCRNTGTLTVAFGADEEDGLRRLLERGEKNGIPGLKILSGGEARGLEPNLSGDVTAALYAPTGGIVSPYQLTIALFENARENGADFFFNARVDKIKFGKFFTVTDYAGREYLGHNIINCAGLSASGIARKIGDISFNIEARRGEYILFDKTFVTAMPIFQMPSKLGKGVLASPTADGNYFYGPSSHDTADKWDKSTTQEGLEFVRARGQKSVVPPEPLAQITTFSGLRALADTGDFIVERSGKNPSFINLAGICSPGLTSAPAIAEYAAELFEFPKRENFKSGRKKIPSFFEATTDERRALIAADPLYGHVVCRCETVTEGEIVEAVRRGARTVDGVKRRVRTGMGRCQGSFCTAAIMKIIAEVTGLTLEEITKSGGSSQIVYGDIKEIGYEG